MGIIRMKEKMQLLGPEKGGIPSLGMRTYIVKAGPFYGGCYVRTCNCDLKKVAPPDARMICNAHAIANLKKLLHLAQGQYSMQRVRNVNL